MSILSCLYDCFGVPSRSSRQRACRQGAAPRLEVLENRLAPAVQLTYGGPGTALVLIDDASGPPATVRISDASTPTLTIKLGTGAFAEGSTLAPGLTYENASSPRTSHSAMLDIGSLNNISTIVAVLPGDTLDLGILADIRGGVGSISASSATINVSSVNTTYATPGDVSLTASGSLTVGTHGLIETGNGTISLAADVNANGTGNSNTDALTIDPGAVVVSTNASASAITLRGARMSIAPGSSPAEVGSLPVLGTKPSATLHGLNNPHALAFDDNGNLFVANNGNGTVSEFAPGSTTPKATLSGLKNPGALAFDDKGDLFVANCGIASNATTVSEFAPGSTTPKATLKGLGFPAALAFDGSGNLFVANLIGNTVSEFAPGSTTPTATLSGLVHPDALAFDASGNLFVANYGNNGAGTTVSELAPGSTTPTATLSGLNGPDALAFDASGNLFVANSLDGTVSEFAPGSTTPMATLTELYFPDALAFDASGNLFVANKGQQGGGPTVSELAPGSTTPTATLTGLIGPDALAFDASGDLFVANDDGGSTVSTVSEFTPASYRPAAGGVVLRTARPTEAMSLGGSTAPSSHGGFDLPYFGWKAMSLGARSTPPDTLSLSNAELARIFTTASGTVTIGDSSQTGNITFQDARPATTAGASTVVMQSTYGSGGIFLNASKGTAINGNGGTVSLTPGTSGVNGTLSAKYALIASNGFTATGLKLNLSLPFAPKPGQTITLIDDTGSAISGVFANLMDGGTTTASYDGKTYPLTASYASGTGKDLVVTASPVTPARPANITSSSATLKGVLQGTSSSAVTRTGYWTGYWSWTGTWTWTWVWVWTMAARA